MRCTWKKYSRRKASRISPFQPTAVFGLDQTRITPCSTWHLSSTCFKNSWTAITWTASYGWFLILLYTRFPITSTNGALDVLICLSARLRYARNFHFIIRTYLVSQSNNSLDLSLVKGITKQRKQFMVDFLQKLDQSTVKKSKKYTSGTLHCNVWSKYKGINFGVS